VQQDFYVVLKQRYETNLKQGLSGHRVAAIRKITLLVAACGAPRLWWVWIRP